MPSGVLFPHLQRQIAWRDFANGSETSVRAAASGVVALVVNRSSGGWWRWYAIGWLGVRFAEGKARSRDAGKRAAVAWWGSMTVADRDPDIEND